MAVGKCLSVGIGRLAIVRFACVNVVRLAVERLSVGIRDPLIIDYIALEQLALDDCRLFVDCVAGGIDFVYGGALAL